MSACHAPVLDTVAFQLAAGLEEYEQSVQKMADTWLDMDLYRSVGDQIEQIRLYSAALPQLSVPWVELLIAHAEVVHCLWRGPQPAAMANGRTLRQARNHHSNCVAALHSGSLRLIAGL